MVEFGQCSYEPHLSDKNFNLNLFIKPNAIYTISLFYQNYYPLNELRHKPKEVFPKNDRMFYLNSK